MKLKNKKTGEIVEVESCNSTTGTIGLFFAEGRECDRAYNSLAELCEEWTDYEEPKEFWHISCEGKINRVPYDEHCYYQEREIGNYFDTEEEAEKAVRKLQAWKRLKDAGFKFGGWEESVHEDSNIIYCTIPNGSDIEVSDLDLLFKRGGEE